MTRIAVTGAGGFVGRYVLEHLRTLDCEIVAAHRTPPQAPAESTNVRNVQLDIHEADDAVYERLGRPDVVIHLAWGGLPNYGSLHHIETELDAQYRFIKQLVRGGLKRVVIAGTCFEYGMQNGELSEQDPCLPNTVYGHAKLTLLRHLQFLQAAHPFDLTWARLFYMYGDGQSPKSLYSQFQVAVAKGDGVFPMSGGEQLRDFLPVATIASYLGRLALVPGNHGPVNLCSGQPISVRNLVEAWRADAKADIQLDFGKYPYASYEPRAFWGNPDRLNRILER